MSVEIAQVNSGANPGVYANQRRLARTAVGAVRWQLVTNANQNRLDFFYSIDDGATWTERTGLRISGVDIATGASMRIIGGGGAGERIAVIYQRSSDNHMMCAFGTFRGDRRNFDWVNDSPQIASEGRSSSNYNRPDLEGYWNGSAWIVACVWGERYTATNKGLVRFSRVRVSDQVMSARMSVIDEQFGTSTAPYPSVSIKHLSDRRAVDQSNPNLYLSWFHGIDQDALERRHMMLLPKSGWTWQAGVRRTLANDGVSSGLISSCYTGQRAAQVAVAAGDSSLIVVHLQQPSDGDRQTLQVPDLGLGEITAVSSTWDNWSADIYVLAAGTSNKRPHFIVYDWATRTWGTWTEINTDTVMDDTLTARGGSGGSVIECSYVIDQTTSVSWRFETVTTPNVAPDRPAWTSQGGARDTSTSLPLIWVHSDADGDPQAQYRLRRSVNGGAVEYWNGSTWQATQIDLSSATQQVTLPAGWASDGDVVEYTVATSDGVKWSVWSPSLTVIGSTRVNPTIDQPTAGAWPDPQVTVDWTVVEQAAYRVRLIVDATGGILHDSGWVGEPNTRTYLIPATVDDGAAYTVELTTQNDEGLASAVITVAITAALTPPPTPTITFGTDPAAGTITVTVDNGTPGVGEDPADHNVIERRPTASVDGWVAPTGGEEVAADGSFVDREVASGVDYTYRAVAISELGAATVSAETA